MLSRQAVLKGVCAAALIFVSLQTLAYLHSHELPSLPFHRISPFIKNDIHCYGKPDCFPSKRRFSLFDAKNNKEFCLKHGATFRDPPPRLATVTAQFGKHEKHYQRALGTHVLHNEVHGTDIHILSTKIIDDLWNKPAFILDLLLAEMEKPENDRLEWLFWVDRDTIILDTCRSPLSYLPPTEREFNRTEDRTRPPEAIEKIYMLATKDWNGLNNGVFLVRVNRWAVDLFVAILAHRYYRPGVELTFTEQSAMGFLLEEPQFRDNVVWVPQWWFNAYPRGKDKENFAPLKDDIDAEGYHARRGDFLVHFAGVGGRDKAMSPWLDIAETAVSGWAAESKERDLDTEIRDFWAAWKNI
ncbi:galactosyl transferase GMA12/MNN10 family-domain-containing protein [Achaetomium macrosporum]|uniref:Galactosyl transferase GMA12/MNN10 family-domain-containing protein n=1 Tax=Achaetomium macrosporum TaxID=79813 RepID=A0AAN7C0P1_9PEZI|nr:galactosyl transferase GMA12/MNN10 family-domain-containing protein [Achaetomium macrosporum]